MGWEAASWVCAVDLGQCCSGAARLICFLFAFDANAARDLLLVNLVGYIHSLNDCPSTRFFLSLAHQDDLCLYVAMLYTSSYSSASPPKSIYAFAIPQLT